MNVSSLLRAALPPYELEVESGPEAGQRIPLGRTVSVGRDGSSDVRFADDTVSKRHALLGTTSTGLWVRDLGSTNGTWVNGSRIDRTSTLLPGDAVQFGEVRLRVVSINRNPGPPEAEPGIPGCSRCGGSGVIACPTERRCAFCGGSGTRLEYQYDMWQKRSVARYVSCMSCRQGPVACSKCNGTGWRSCPSCRRARRKSRRELSD
jgi:hypothetical protein